MTFLGLAAPRSTERFGERVNRSQDADRSLKSSREEATAVEWAPGPAVTAHPVVGDRRSLLSNYCVAVGMKRRSRVVFIVSMALVALVGIVGGLRVWYVLNQREKTDAAFAAMRVIDRRVDLQSVVPVAKRTESGVEVRPWGDGPGPNIHYSIDASETPDWRVRVDRAMEKAGFGPDETAWTTQVRGWPVGITISNPSNRNGNTAGLDIFTS